MSGSFPLNLLKFVFFILLFLSLIFGFEKTLDFDAYYENYYSEFKQFEFGFELTLEFFRSLGLEFEIVWIFLFGIITIFLGCIFWESRLFFISAPNLFLLSNGFLGTQLRYALAITTFFFIFRRYSLKKSKLHIPALLLPITFHISIIFYAVLGICSKKIKDTFYISGYRSLFLLLFFVVFLGYVATQLDNIFLSLNYTYYIDSRFSVGKSWSSLIYLFLMCVICCLLLLKKTFYEYRHEICLLLFVAITAIIFQSSSVVSGRLAKFVLLFEPVIIFSIFERIRYKKQNLILIMFILLAFYSKTFVFVYL
jgi:hypothetical protein